MEVLSLEKICKAKSSNIAQKDLENNNGCYPIYGASGFIKNVDFYKFEKPYLAIVKDGAGVGRVMALPGKSSIIGTMQAIIPNDNVDIDYLFYYLKTKKLGRYYTGATIPHIYFKDYKFEKCNIYSLEEQRKISKKLKLIDNLIDYKNKQIEHLNQLIKSQFVEMFENKKFDVKLIKNITEVVTKGTTPSSIGFQFDDNGTVNFVKIESIDMTGKLIREKFAHITNECDEKLKRSKLKNNDILFSIAGAIGRTAIVSEEILPANTNQALAIIRLNSDRVNVKFLNYMLNSEYVIKQYNKKKQGVAQINLSLNDVSNLEILIPPVELQMKFEKIVEQIDKQKFEFEKILKKLDELQASLMQEYFG